MQARIDAATKRTQEHGEELAAQQAELLELEARATQLRRALTAEAASAGVVANGDRLARLDAAALQAASEEEAAATELASVQGRRAVAEDDVEELNATLEKLRKLGFVVSCAAVSCIMCWARSRSLPCSRGRRRRSKGSWLLWSGLGRRSPAIAPKPSRPLPPLQRPRGVPQWRCSEHRRRQRQRSVHWHCNRSINVLPPMAAGVLEREAWGVRLRMMSALWWHEPRRGRTRKSSSRCPHRLPTTCGLWRSNSLPLLRPWLAVGTSRRLSHSQCQC